MLLVESKMYAYPLYLWWEGKHFTELFSKAIVSVVITSAIFFVFKVLLGL